jgi:hypothetical protein
VGGDRYGASVHLSWAPPLLSSSDDPVDRFKLAYWLASEKSCFSQPNVPCFSYQETSPILALTNASVTGLRPDMSYAFKVFSGNANGFEVRGSDALTGVGTSHMPGPVRRLSVTPRTNSSLMLSWVNPSNPTTHNFRIVVTDVDCAAAAAAAGASPAALAAQCVRSWEESCASGTCAAAHSFCVGNISPSLLTAHPSLCLPASIPHPSPTPAISPFSPVL